MTEFQTITFEQSGADRQYHPQPARCRKRDERHDDSRARRCRGAVRHRRDEGRHASPGPAGSSVREAISSRSRGAEPWTPHQGRRRRPAPGDVDVRPDGRGADHRRQRHRRRRGLLARGHRRPGARGRVGVVHDGLHQGRAQPRRQLVVLPAAAHRHRQDQGADADQPDADRRRGVTSGGWSPRWCPTPNSPPSIDAAGQPNGLHAQAVPTAR